MGSNLTESSAFSANVVGPDPSNFVTAASVRVMGSALACRTKALQDGKITVAAGVTLTCASGGTVLLDTGSALVSYGTVELSGTGADKTTIAEAEIDACAVVVSCDIESGAELTVKGGAAIVSQAGSMATFAGRTRGRPRVLLTDANHSLGPTDGTRFELAVPTGARVITLLSVTGQTAENEEVMEFFMPSMVSSPPGTSGSYEFRREGGTAIARMESHGTFLGSVSAQFEFTSGVWRLWLNSGFVVADSLLYGVYTYPGVS